MDANGRESTAKVLEGVKNLLESVAIVIAGVWVASTYWCEREYEPSTHSASISVMPAVVEVTPLESGIVAIRARAEISNSSETRVNVLGALATGFGHTLEFNESGGGGLGGAAGSASASYNRCVSASSNEIVFASQLNMNASSWWLEPGEKVVFERVFYVPSRLYQQVDVSVDLWTVREADDISLVFIDASSTINPTFVVEGATLTGDTLDDELDERGYAHIGSRVAVAIPP